MPREELPQGQIVPAARPVGAFIQPARPNIAAPMAPQMMPNPGGVRTIGQGSGGSVQGINQFQELAQALAPFSRGLIQLANYGAELYASSEYEKGQSEVARAKVLANQQMQRSAAEYAAENRRLDKTDPIAAVMMDRVNPFREGGRLNRLARIAALEIGPAVNEAYATTPGAAALPLGSPELKRIEAQAVQGVLSKYSPYGLTESSPGFIEYVLPQIGQAGQKLYEKHLDNRVRHLNETAWREAAAEATRIWGNAVQSGQVEWTETDEAGQAMRFTASRAQEPALWERGVRRSMAAVFAKLQTETGITGEPTKLALEAGREVIKRAGVAKDFALEKLVLGVEIGAPRKDGTRATIGDLLGAEAFEAEHRISTMVYERDQRTQKTKLEEFETELSRLTYNMPDGPERGAAINQLVSKYSQFVPLGDLYRSVDATSRTLDSVAGRSYNTSGVDALLQDMQGRVGASWNAAQADRDFENALSGVAPQDRDDYRRRYADLRTSKEREQDDAPLQLITPAITSAIKSRLKWAYPGSATEASLRGADIGSMMAWGDADVAESARRQYAAYQQHVLSRLREAEGKKGSKLNAAEIQSVTTRALEEYGKKDKDSFDYLFPGSNQTDTPSVGGRAQDPSGQRPGSGGGSGSGGGAARPIPTVYPSGQLDNMPNRANRLRARETVLNLDSVSEEITRVLNGGRPSSAVMRAARDAGYGGNVGQFLIDQAGAYQGLKIAPADRNRLLRGSRAAQGTGEAFRAAAAPSTPLQWISGSWWMNALTGAAPARAATFNPAQGGGRYGEGPFTGSGVPTTWSGGSPYGTPYVNQRASTSGRGDRECFSAASAMIAGVYTGRPITLSTYNAVRQQFGDSTLSSSQVSALSRLGVRATVQDNGSIDEVARIVRSGRPVAIGLNHNGASGHWIVVAGVTANGDFVVNDPFGKLRQVRNGGWERRNTGSPDDRTGMGVVYGRQFLRSIFEDRGAGTGRIMRVDGSPVRQAGRPPEAAVAAATRRGGGLTGIATYYTGSGGSDGVAGGPTANGEPYDPSKMTAAVQRSLRGKYLNKWVRVEDLDTGRSVRVWVNDVGSMGGTDRSINRSDPRVIDLSTAAFRALFGSTSRGTGRIRIQLDQR